MILGADCTFTAGDPPVVCRAPASWMRFTLDRVMPIELLCAKHRRDGDRAIPPTMRRAEPSTFWRDRR